MTRANILKKFFKKYFNSDTSGNSTVTVMQDFMSKNDSLPGGGSDSVTKLQLVFEMDEETFTDGYYIYADHAELLQKFQNGETIILLDESGKELGKLDFSSDGENNIASTTTCRVYQYGATQPKASIFWSRFYLYEDDTSGKIPVEQFFSQEFALS